MRNLFILVIAFSFIISGCDKHGNNETKFTGAEPEIVLRETDIKQYNAGQRLFLKNCAVCHGKQGEGARNWRKPGENGKNLAPPLNGTGHSWHHSTNVLENVIRNGTAKTGGNMPAWKDKLSDGEIKSILSWITAQWPDELYTAWYNRFHQEK